MSSLPDLAAIRRQFPALKQDLVFMENAGGSQVPTCVADAIREYMLERYVQLGAPYELSGQATEVVADAHTFVGTLMNGNGTGTTILGPSTSQLLAMLARSMTPRIGPGDEIVVAETGHEANVGPWVRLAAETGAKLVWWPVDRDACDCTLDGLRGCLTDRTSIVALPHVSNLLGAIADLRAVCDLAHDAGARVVADGVAFAPHRVVDVEAWDVDWYGYSTYKVYGPHMAALWGRHDAVAEIIGPNHFFIDPADVPYKLELGGVSHEACAGIRALGLYLAFLVGEDVPSGPFPRELVERSFRRMGELERPLQTAIVDSLRSRDDVRIVGPAHCGPDRVATISLVAEGRSSQAISEALVEHGFAQRFGHMYAHRLCVGLGIEPEEGVVRLSLVHYNTPAEVDRLLSALDAILAAPRESMGNRA